MSNPPTPPATEMAPASTDLAPPRRRLRIGALLAALLEALHSLLARCRGQTADHPGSRWGIIRFLNEREAEADRLDRLRNPGDYRGR